MQHRETEAHNQRVDHLTTKQQDVPRGKSFDDNYIVKNLVINICGMTVLLF